MEKEISSAIIDRICQNIGGKWLILGGALVQLYYNGERATEDIDLVSMGHSEKSKEVLQNDLLQFALKNFQMGPEFMNLAVEFFLKDLPGWESEVILLRKGQAGEVYRPTLTLFCALKIRRGSEIDLSDIRCAIQREGIEKLDLKKLEIWVGAERSARVLSLSKK